MPMNNNYEKKLSVPLVMFIVYAVLTFTGAARHELWFDEAQAWCIVRDNDFGGIIEQLRCEGHPALWYLILLPFARLGSSCGVIPFISWAFSTAAAALVLFKAPFGNIMKAAVVFSGGFLFYNSVISRPYCVIELMLFLIAIIYPERKKRPLLYGTLVAILANTHIFICGLVGIIGIYMITDLILDFRKNSAKQNALNFAGLFIAGAGVILLVLPLIGSLSSNNMINDMSGGLSGVSLSGLAFSIPETMYSAIFSAFDLPVGYIISALPALAAAAFVILLRKNRRCFISALVFSAFYIFINSVIWRTNTNRASVFIYVLVFLYWIAAEEKFPERKHSAEGISMRLVKLVFKADENAGKVCGVILSAVLFLTVPAAAYSLFADIAGDFSPSKRAASYIGKELGSEAVYVFTDEPMPQVAAYLPGCRFYSLSQGKFTTYYIHSKEETAGSLDDLRGYPEVYAVSHGRANIGNAFNASGYIPFDANSDYIAVYRLDIPA